MKYYQLNLFLVLTICLTLTFACGNDDEGPSAEDCETRNVSYSGDIVPILNQTCAIPNCHVNGFINGDYEMYADLKAQSDNGSLRNQVESGAMPPSNTAGPTELTDNEVETFLCWIEDGAPEN
jgi:hypothetical protein